MRQRKKPILLVTVLVCSLGAVAFMGYRPVDGPPEQATPPPTGNKDVSPPTDPKKIHDMVQSKADVANTEKMKPNPAMPPGVPGPPDTPLGLKPVVKPYKPTYSDSATSVQWYTDATPKESPNASGNTKVTPSTRGPRPKSTP